MKIKRAGGDWSWVHFKYERLTTFCFVCGKLGHSERDYNVVYANPGKELERTYGTWLRAPSKNIKTETTSRWLRNGKGKGNWGGSNMSATGSGKEENEAKFKEDGQLVVTKLENNSRIMAKARNQEITGDFNDMLFGFEKVGGRPHPRYLLEGFNNTIMECGLEDLGFNGSAFTWEKSRGTEAWIQERGVLRKLRSRRDGYGVRRYNEVRWEFLKLLEQQEVYWKQRAKQFWLQEGDQNTRFFHKFASGRKKTNQICRLKDKHGEWKSNEVDIQEIIIDYFSELFTSLSNAGELSSGERVQNVTEEQNWQLLEPISNEEVKCATFSMHPEKSPGYDGLNPAFYQAYWSIVEKDVVGFCQNFFNTRELQEEVNRTVVCLIPKVKQPQQMSDLRPISLCSVLSRILSKVMINRLKVRLPTLISANKSAFVEGRLLTDNALIAFEVNHYIKRRSQGINGVAGLKIDVSKAYDRQGDPMSPYIYILCAEGLSSTIKRNEEAGLIHGCSVARGAPAVSHLLFADDCYFFFKAIESEATVMKNIIKRYEELSGQAINIHKSTITFSPNTLQVNREAICGILEVSEISIPGKYLGLPMNVGRRKNEVFNFLSDRVRKKLQSWRNTAMSKAGKCLLLKIAAQSISNFWMNLMLIPNEVCYTIQRQMNSFWWGGGNNSKGIRWMSWERLCNVKEAGGLGFKDLRSFNVAMLAKQGWRLLNNENPRVTNILKARYFPNTDFLNAKLGDNPSYMWRSILEAQDVVKTGMETVIWKVPWLPDRENGYITSEMPSELEDATVLSLMVTNERKWDEEILTDLFNDRDVQFIKNIPLSDIDRRDSWMWFFDGKGEFSVKSCYRKLVGEYSTPDTVGLREWIQVLQGEQVMDTFKRLFRTGTKEQCVLVAVLYWSLWNRRNKWVWDKIDMLVFGTKAAALNLLTDWRKAQMEGNKYTPVVSSSSRKWRKPQAGWVKINVDAATFTGTHSTGIGRVIRDDNGEFLRAMCQQRSGKKDLPMILFNARFKNSGLVQGQDFGMVCEVEGQFQAVREPPSEQGDYEGAGMRAGDKIVTPPSK
ncbi:hypothetical protein AgCh_024343 [Apium graveolens]